MLIDSSMSAWPAGAYDRKTSIPQTSRAKPKGLRDRLNSHASGRRSGDQFCVYVCDRFVVPTLTVDQQAQIADGQLALDKLTRQLIHDRYTYRFVPTPDPSAARTLDRDIQRGALAAGKPFLNPI
jgi:hypothetical protein